MFAEKNLVINISKAKMLMGKILDIVSSTLLEIAKFFSPPVFVLTLPSVWNVLALVLQTATSSPVVGSELRIYLPESDLSIISKDTHTPMQTLWLLSDSAPDHFYNHLSLL